VNENVDAYRDRDAVGARPYRCRVEGDVLRNEKGEVRQFRTLAEAVAAGRVKQSYIPGRNAELIRTEATRIIRGPIPAAVRKELYAAVKAGYLGHFKKDGLRPEVFFHPEHRDTAIECQNREAAAAIEAISKVVDRECACGAKPTNLTAGNERWEPDNQDEPLGLKTPNITHGD